ncbi:MULTISPECIES: type II toxin-antitoxin system ParD family antitoxin [Erwinia]|uniref:Antitoxin ParD n=1 Tax=Erwinia pyrifoliae TaxID=79967 RepID=A0ABY5X9U7_ERWPY|nr:MULTISPECIES: type II toxin-antitoxin system ParD family antitoxin [Erwinia]ADP10459.1 putative addiction module antidote protein [Erwinia sp. Ejp617]AUX71690.1 type II toxin-antitoxin system ParD family antitoxin [Erwinia pyrifoliae]MCA8878083.1 type II toxin-antitoxin system ParD family antitoxin [Erwinia pyrifoliae]MCT2386165.1 type II toxin-antitoxin system ParD family antitoxin [Erwinia pyrifoliae]MCU8588238.1 type II toxin-antitoxin system ParD family antitoxin [Erwinia pyrifoliae]
MRTTQQMSITLPNEMAAQIKSRVASGEYASESEVIREGLRALAARDHAVEKWLSEQVVPAYEALKTDPERGISGIQLREKLAEEHRKLSKG